MQGFYCRYFLVPKKTGGLRMHRGDAVTHVNNQTSVTVCKAGRLVHLNRFEGRLLPRHSDPQTQEIPAFVIPKVTLPVQPSPVSAIL